jgi:hypothetical protein
MSKRVVRRQPRGGSSARLRDHAGGLSGGDERAERQMAVQSCQMSQSWPAVGSDNVARAFFITL